MLEAVAVSWSAAERYATSAEVIWLVVKASSAPAMAACVCVSCALAVRRWSSRRPAPFLFGSRPAARPLAPRCSRPAAQPRGPRPPPRRSSSRP